MAKKTYRTYRLKGLQLLLLDESGRSIEVSFRGGIQIDSTAKFTTSDEKMQGALEKSSGFGRDYYLESVREDSPVADSAPAAKSEEAVKEPAAEEVTVQRVEVADKSEAIEWLKEHFPENGYTATKLRTEEKFKATCAACNVEFVFTD